MGDVTICSGLPPENPTVRPHPAVYVTNVLLEFQLEGLPRHIQIFCEGPIACPSQLRVGLAGLPRRVAVQGII